MRCIIVSKKLRKTVQRQRVAKQARAWDTSGDTSSRAHSWAEVATGAGAGVTDSARAGGNGFSESSGKVVSLCASALSRTGLVAEFAGDVDSSWWGVCEDACGMLRFDIKPDPRGKKDNTLLWIGNRRTHCVLGTDAGFGQSIIT